MVKEYLEKLHVEYEQEDHTLQEKIKNKKIQLKENIEFIKLLDETTDDSYESFTPREINSKNKTKITSLRDEQKVILQELDQLKIEEIAISQKIDELNSVMKFENERNEIQDAPEGVNKIDQTFRLKLLETQENERQRISRELHDSTVQNLTSLVHKSELCSKLIEMDPIRCKLELLTLNRTLREVINNTRQMIYNLRPMSFDDIGLDVTIQYSLRKLESNSSVKINFTMNGEPIVLSSVVGITILRMIQECCNNAIRHGNANIIHVKLNYEVDSITIIIEDNGSGFDVESLPKTSRDDHSGFGLSMMRERVYLLSGTLQIKSNRGEGTTIIAKIPANQKEERVND